MPQRVVLAAHEHVGSWGAWSSLGGQWTSGAGAVCQPGTTTIDIFEREPDLGLWQLATS